VATICALNNYPLAKMMALAAAGSIPRQHVWGLDALAARGDRIAVAPFHEPEEHHPLDRLSRRARGVLGHLDQEAFAVRRLRRSDALYCADGYGLAGIALVRRALPATRLVSVVHHPISNRLRLAAAAAHDALLCLSPTVRRALERDLPGGSRPALIDAAWGPDLTSPLYETSSEDAGVVSAGKSNRDLATLARALSATGTPALIYDLTGQLPAHAVGAGIRVRRPGGEGADPDSPGGYLASTAIHDVGRASIVAIPVADPNRLTGLTEAIDALAFAKPILATRSPIFPFDVEAIGCGRWIEPGDAAGWESAIRELSGDDAARREMGAAGRRFAEREYNYGAFCSALSESLRES
jgi:hypothetical protein